MIITSRLVFTQIKLGQRAYLSRILPSIGRTLPLFLIHPLPAIHLVHVLGSLLTTASHASNDALQQILSTICSPSSILFDPRYTSRPKPHVGLLNRTFPPSPRDGYKTPARLPSTISVHNLATAEERAAFASAIMDKRNPNSFQQLEKLGEGTYATVRCSLTNIYLPAFAFVDGST